jgi:hypothetical protein
MSYQPESRTRENRTSGSEGGVTQTNASSLPLSGGMEKRGHWMEKLKLGTTEKRHQTRPVGGDGMVGRSRG